MKSIETLRRKYDCFVRSGNHVKALQTMQQIARLSAVHETVERTTVRDLYAALSPADKEKELKGLQRGKLSKEEAKGVEKILMANRKDDGVTGESTLWKLVQGITAHSRELEPRRQRDLQEIAGDLMNRVKL